MTSFAWQTAITSAGFLSGTMIQGLLILNYPEVDFKPYQGILLGYACLLVAIFINTVVSSRLPSIESCILVIHILGFFVVVIVIGYMAPHSTASEVFGTFINGGMWPTQGLSVMVGLIGNVFSFTGMCANYTAQYDC
jgi:choline transport protein